MQTNEQIIKRITQGIALFWILMKSISLNLWVKERDYPLVPIVDMASWLHFGFLALFFTLAFWIIFKPGSKYIIMAILVTEAISLLGDQNRLQPWHYQFIFCFFAIAFNDKEKQKALQAILLITISTYLFSGLQKLNPDFIKSVWSVPILKTFLHLPANVIQHPAVQGAGYGIPLLEITGAIGLMFTRTMRIAACLLIAIHVFILFFLSPLGIDFNSVVWPWNLQLILLLYFVFIKNGILFTARVFKSAANYVVAVFWILMPVLGLFGYWDKFLSSAMYSGKEKLNRFYFTDSSRIPRELRKYAVYSKQNASARIALITWSVKELNVAPVGEPRLLKSIVKQLNERYHSLDTLFVLTPNL